ncbi:MAG: pirin family protein [Bdellovibrionales bacterium]
MKKLLYTLRSETLHWVGDGFPVRSMFNYMEHAKDFSPFLLMDYAAPSEFSPTQESRGVGEHPHRGFETVTIIYAGEVAHRDSRGGGGLIKTGDVQWMTAGAGLVHEEKHGPDFTKKGGIMEMVQLWVNLPKKDKMTQPKYQGILKEQIPTVPLADEAGSVRVIAGDFLNKKGPASTFSPVNLWDMRTKDEKTVHLEVPDGQTAALFVLEGELELEDGKSVNSATIALFERKGGHISFKSKKDSKILFLGGEPLPDPVVGHGPFVMTTQGDLKQAFLDYQQGLMGRLAQ